MLTKLAPNVLQLSEGMAHEQSDSLGSERHSRTHTQGWIIIPQRITMRKVLIFVTFLACVPAWCRPGSDKGVIGAWEGESKCMVPDSPCHDEHVLYQIAEDKKDPFQLKIDAYKIIDGAPEFMGTVTCHYQSKVGALSCTSSSREKD